jgi:hypothetical protein
MAAKEYFTQQNYYYGNAIIGGEPCTIGYFKKFRLRWLGTQMNTFIIVAETDKTVTRPMIEGFSTLAFNYALANHNGWPRGLQGATACIAVIKATSFDEQAILYCNRVEKKHFSAFEISVLYDKNSGRAMRYINKPYWGYMFFNYFSKIIDSLQGKL